MSLSDYTEAALLNSLTGKTSSFGALASRPTWYVALLTQTASDADTGSTIHEANYGSYARVQTAASDWTTATGTSPTKVSNANPLLFPQATGGTNTITSFAVCDAASAGNVLFSGDLDTPLAVSVNIAAQFSIGTLGLTLD